MAADLTTRSDFGRIANARSQRSHRLDEKDAEAPREESVTLRPPSEAGEKGEGASVRSDQGRVGSTGSALRSTNVAGPSKPRTPLDHLRSSARSLARILTKFSKFIGPGFMVSVAYIDPGNYATDVAAGASYRFRLLFMILLSNLFAIFLQSLCIKLGSVTGMNLAEMIKAHCPPWLNYLLYFFAESAIIATDIAEVIGTAIALNLLLKIPLVAGCAISIVDVLFILLFYRPTTGSLRGLRAFEFFVMLLVLGVVICFCFQLSMIDRSTTSAREVFAGYLPSKALVESKGLYQACGILGATVMPHSLYLGSGIIQARLKDFDRVHMPPAAGPDAAPNHTETEASTDSNNDEDEPKYRPSLTAIHSCLTYSIVELALCLFTFALF
ncbi:NRAMP-like transporter smf-3, partial [Oleoguttula sp. CCFEE 5521]